MKSPRLRSLPQNIPPKAYYAILQPILRIPFSLSEKYRGHRTMCVSYDGRKKVLNGRWIKDLNDI